VRRKPVTGKEYPLQWDTDDVVKESPEEVLTNGFTVFLESRIAEMIFSRSPPISVI